MGRRLDWCYTTKSATAVVDVCGRHVTFKISAPSSGKVAYRLSAGTKAQFKNLDRAVAKAKSISKQKRKRIDVELLDNKMFEVECCHNQERNVFGWGFTLKEAEGIVQDKIERLEKYFNHEDLPLKERISLLEKKFDRLKFKVDPPDWLKQ